MGKPQTQTAVKHRGRHGKEAKRQAAQTELADLEQAVENLDIKKRFERFDQLPLSQPTAAGLQQAKYEQLTPVQAKAVPLALKGLDVLGAARTGSGKTLAFLVPLLESLYRKKWSAMDGLGALVLSPTRELAVQIFEVLRKIGGHHQFSAGLVIGGKNLKEEKERLQGMNILVATPGRLLQHMDQTIGFDAENLQMLVLDEADRILDMGFQASVNAIVGHLPETRQTLLFSATQTKSVKDLARLSLQEPEYVWVRDEQAAAASASASTSNDPDSADSKLDLPSNLSQHYIVVPLDQKLDRLWSFVKTHLFHKTIVFLSSCKQVRFVFEAFRQLRPGVPLMHLHGKQKQMQRLEIYNRFVQSEHAVLFATDIAARGLDFPSVGWVVQVDCPEDVDTYVHRVGRTARYQSKGKALLFLTPSEEPGMLRRFTSKGLKVDPIKVRDSKQQTVSKQLQSLAFKSPEVKFLAQRSFISYVRSVFLQKDKGVFKFDDLPLEEFATSLGLAGAPQIKFTSKDASSSKKNAARSIQTAEQEDEDSSSEEDEEPTNVFGAKRAARQAVEDEPKSQKDKQTRTKVDRMFGRKNQGILSEHYNKVLDRQDGESPAVAGTSGNAEEDDFLTLKRADHALDENDDAADSTHLSKRKLKAGSSKKAIAAQRGQGNKLTFDEEGEAHPLYELQTEEDFAKAGDAKKLGQEFVDAERAVLQQQDVVDRARAKERKRDKKRKRKEAERIAAGLEPKALAPEFDGDDDGYVSPDFDLPKEGGGGEDAEHGAEEDYEAAAMRVLKKRRV